MRINLQVERPIPLAEVPQHIPRRRGKKVHYSTIYRWVTKGARGKILESFMVGGVRFTTIEAVDRFLNAKSNEKPDASPPDTDRAIEEMLTADGV